MRGAAVLGTCDVCGAADVPVRACTDPMDATELRCSICRVAIYGDEPGDQVDGG